MEVLKNSTNELKSNINSDSNEFILKSSCLWEFYKIRLLNQKSRCSQKFYKAKTETI